MPWDQERALRALHNKKLAIKLLRSAGLERDTSMTVRIARDVAIVALSVGVALAVEFFWPKGGAKPEPPKVATLVLGLFGLAYAYFQWRDARREATFDKFYDRLKIVNEYIHKTEAAADLVKHFFGNTNDKDSRQKFMYIYLELDNLEYIVGKYRLGYADPRLAVRGLLTFASRCKSSEFCQLVSECVAVAGYEKETRKLVNKIIEQVKMIEHSARAVK